MMAVMAQRLAGDDVAALTAAGRRDGGGEKMAVVLMAGVDSFSSMIGR